MRPNYILAIAYRDFIKFLRDPARILGSLIFPVVFVGIMGISMDSNLGAEVGFSFLLFTFTGIYAQTLFQSAAIGMVYMIEDRENDFSQEIFVSPISRYAIVLGKIAGESIVAMAQGIAILILGMFIGVGLSLTQFIGLWIVGWIVCFFGGAFGVLILSNLSSQRAANQIFPFVMLPQFFLGGVFAPIRVLPWYLDIASRLTPMRYVVDLTRAVYYTDLADYSQVVLESGWFNLGVIAVFSGIFMVIGTFIFVRSERNR